MADASSGLVSGWTAIVLTSTNRNRGSAFLAEFRRRQRAGFIPAETHILTVDDPQTKVGSGRLQGRAMWWPVQAQPRVRVQPWRGLGVRDGRRDRVHGVRRRSLHGQRQVPQGDHVHREEGERRVERVPVHRRKCPVSWW